MKMHDNVENACKELKLARTHAENGWISQAMQSANRAIEYFREELKRQEQIEKRTHRG